MIRFLHLHTELTRSSATSLPNTARPYPDPAPCNTTLQACSDGLVSGNVINIAAGLTMRDTALEADRIKPLETGVFTGTSRRSSRFCCC